jgi:hypothetical protein
MKEGEVLPSHGKMPRTQMRRAELDLDIDTIQKQARGKKARVAVKRKARDFVTLLNSTV